MDLTGWVWEHFETVKFLFGGIGLALVELILGPVVLPFQFDFVEFVALFHNLLLYPETWSLCLHLDVEIWEEAGEPSKVVCQQDNAESYKH